MDSILAKASHRPYRLLAIIGIYLAIYGLSLIGNPFGLAMSFLFIILVPGFSIARLFETESAIHKFLFGVAFSIFSLIVFGYISGTLGHFSPLSYFFTVLAIAVLFEAYHYRKVASAISTGGQPSSIAKEFRANAKIIGFSLAIFTVFSIFILLDHSTLLTQDEFLQLGRAEGLLSTGAIPKYEPFLIPSEAILAPSGIPILMATLTGINHSWDQNSLVLVPAAIMTLVILFSVEALPSLFSRFSIASDWRVRFLFPLLLLSPFFLARTSLLLGETFGILMLAAAIFIISRKRYALAVFPIATATLLHDYWAIEILLVSILLVISDFGQKLRKHLKQLAMTVAMFLLVWLATYGVNLYTQGHAKAGQSFLFGFSPDVSITDSLAILFSGIGIPYLILGVAGMVTMFYLREKRLLVIWLLITLLPSIFPVISVGDISSRRFIPSLAAVCAFLGFYLVAFLFEKLVGSPPSDAYRLQIVPTKRTSNYWLLFLCIGLAASAGYLVFAITAGSSALSSRYLMLILMIVGICAAVMLLSKNPASRLKIDKFALLVAPIVVSVVALSFIGSQEVGWYETVISSAQMDALEHLKSSLNPGDGISSNFLLASYVGTLVEKPIKTVPPFQTSANNVYSNIFDYGIYNELYSKSNGRDPSAIPMQFYQDGSNLYYVTLQGGNLATDNGRVIRSLETDSHFHFVATLSGGLYLYKVATPMLSIQEVTAIKNLMSSTARPILYSSSLNSSALQQILNAPSVTPINSTSGDNILRDIAYHYPDVSQGSNTTAIIISKLDRNFLSDPRFKIVFADKNIAVYVLQDKFNTNTNTANSDSNYWQVKQSPDSNNSSIVSFNGNSFIGVIPALDENTTGTSKLDNWIEQPLGSGYSMIYSNAKGGQSNHAIAATVDTGSGRWYTAETYLSTSHKPIPLFGYGKIRFSINVDHYSQVIIGLVDYKGVYWEVYAENQTTGWHDITIDLKENHKVSMPGTFNLAYVSKFDISLPASGEDKRLTVYGIGFIPEKSSPADLSTFKISDKILDSTATFEYGFPSSIQSNNLVIFWVKASDDSTGYLSINNATSTSKQIPIGIGKTWSQVCFNTLGSGGTITLAVHDLNSITLSSPYILTAQN